MDRARVYLDDDHDDTQGVDRAGHVVDVCKCRIRESETTMPKEGALAVSCTVPVAVDPPDTLDGLTDSAHSAGVVVTMSVV